MANRPGGADPNSGPDPILVEIGARVRELREAAGLSQRQFAEGAGLSPAYVYTVEVAGPNLSVIVLNRMAQVLGVPITAFFDKTDQAKDMPDPVLAKIASELFRIAKAMDSRRDAIGLLLQELEERLNKSGKASSSKDDGARVDKRGKAGPQIGGSRKDSSNISK